MIGILGSVLEWADVAGHDLPETTVTRSPLYDLAGERRAIKFFDSQYKIDEKTLNGIIATASLAPSAFNLQHWKVLRVKDKSLRQKISDCSWRQPQIIDASELLVILLDKSAWKNLTIVNENFNDQESCQKALASYDSIYRHNSVLARDEAMRSSSMFSMLLMLAAQERGIQSCPMTGCDFRQLQDLLNLGDDCEVCMLIALGVASSKNQVRDRRRLPKHSFLKILDLTN